jgi:hypothetical protein
VVKVAFPVAMVPVPRVVVPSLNVTVPVAVEGVTVAVNFTEAPKVEGLRDEATVTEELDFPKTNPVKEVRTDKRTTTRHVILIIICTPNWSDKIVHQWLKTFDSKIQAAPTSRDGKASRWRGTCGLNPNFCRHHEYKEEVIQWVPGRFEKTRRRGTKSCEASSYTHADFSYWRDSEQAQQFRTVFDPVVLAMEFRLPELENPARQHGVTLSQVAERKIELPELQRASVVIRALSYRRRLFAEIERAKHLLLP